MPANDYFTATSYSDYTETPTYISFQLLGSGNIRFKQNVATYFTVIGGGGGGGGGGGHNNGDGSPAYPSGGGGGGGAFGKISLITDVNVAYSYEIGNGGGAGGGNNSGTIGTDSSVIFSPNKKIVAQGGSFGARHYNGNLGGSGGTLTIQGLDIIVSGASGNGGNGVRIDNIGSDPSGNGTAGMNSSPISIENYPNKFINVGGGGGGTDAHDTNSPPPQPYNGGGGGNGVGGTLGTGVSSGSNYNGIAGIAYGGGGGGGGQPGTGSPIVDGFPVTSGGNGKEGAIFVYFRPPLVNGCQWNPALASESLEWTRGRSDCVDLSGSTIDGIPMTYDDLNEKRKATIFQYKNNSSRFSKKQTYSRLARGIGRQRGHTFATQSDTYTNPNTRNLKIENNAILKCSSSSKNWAFTNQNDTPGPVRRITNNSTVPLTNYIVKRRYLAGNSKWPQF